MIHELRVYHAYPGKIEPLKARFRDHTRRLFTKHGMTNVAYWTNIVREGESTELFYVLGFPDIESRKASWASFAADPEWAAAKAASETDGPLVEKFESYLLSPTDFSPLT